MDFCNGPFFSVWCFSLFDSFCCCKSTHNTQQYKLKVEYINTVFKKVSKSIYETNSVAIY